MTTLPDPNALLQMARALGLHPIVTHAPDSEVIAAVRVYRSERDSRAVVTWETTGIVCHAGLSWAPCSLAEAAAMLEVAAREAAGEKAARAVAKAARQDAENAVATAQIEAECSGIEACGCDESQWWKNHAARLTRNVVGLEGSVSHLAANEEFLESEVARFSARLCEEQGKALDLERDLRAAKEATQAAMDNAQHWEREAARRAKELKAALAENEQLHDALAKAHEPSESD